MPSKQERIEAEIKMIFGPEAKEVQAYLESKFWYAEAVKDDNDAE